MNNFEAKAVTAFYYELFKRVHQGASLAVQWLRLCTSSEGGTGSIPGRGTKIPRALQPINK